MFRYNCDLKRHILTHKATKAIQNLFVEEKKKDVVEFEVDLEEKRIGTNYCGKLTYREVPSSLIKYKKNHTSFQDSLGFSTMDDWEAFVDVSNVLCLPLSAHGDPETVAVCSFKDELGIETHKFAWNSAPQVTVSNSAVQLSSLDDASVTDEEVLETLDDILNDASLIKKKEESSNGCGDLCLKVPLQPVSHHHQEPEAELSPPRGQYI